MALETKLGLEISLAIISFAFLVLTVVHLINYWQHHLPHIELRHGIAEISGARTGIVELREGINKFVDGLNKTHRRANLVAFIGYALSCLATVIALIVLLNTEF
jgi:hypothetical protein